MGFQRIRARSVSEAVYEQIRNAILSGDFRPGSTLPSERRLVELLGANRQAVREALQRLEHHGLVAIQHGGGTRVLDFRESAGLDLLFQLIARPTGGLDLKVARNSAELRSVITPDMARLAALRTGPQLGGELRAAVERIAATEGSFPSVDREVEAFWIVVARASQNVAYQLVNNTMRSIHEHFGHSLRHAAREELENTGRYREIADAIAAGDTERAEAAARTHWQLILRALGGGHPEP